MIKAQKDLLAVDDSIQLDNPTDQDSSVYLHYISGAGSVLVEGSSDGINWIALAVANMNSGAGVVPPTAITAVGLYRATFYYGFDFVRVRKTVGSASCVVQLGLALV